jgi:cytochrome P450
MPGQSVTPVIVGRGRSLRYFASFVSDPMTMTRALHQAHGPFAVLQFPWSRRSPPAILLCLANAELYRAAFAASEVWRGVKIYYGIKNHASDRLAMSMTRLRGARHAHYRRLLAPPLSKPAVMASGPAMAALAEEEVSSWPRDVPVDLLPLTEHLMLKFAIGLLFGNDHERAMPIAKMITKEAAATRILSGRELVSWIATAAKHRNAPFWSGPRRSAATSMPRTFSRSSSITPTRRACRRAAPSSAASAASPLGRLTRPAKTA